MERHQLQSQVNERETNSTRRTVLVKRLDYLENIQDVTKKEQPQNFEHTEYQHKKYRTNLLSEVAGTHDDSVSIEKVVLHQADEEESSVEVTVSCHLLHSSSSLVTTAPPSQTSWD